jgi:peptidyl-prolyl cis-trans isomerase D
MKGISAFKGPDGKFSRENYRFALKNAGYSETEFEENVRTESARTVMQAAIIAGNTMPATAIDTVLGYIIETRDLTLTTLDNTNLRTAIVDPDAAALQTYYDANVVTYTLPERKQITYAILTPDMILDQVEVSDDALRLVERLAFLDMEQASAKLAEIVAGTTTFDAVVADRGLNLADIDLGDVSQSDLGAAGAGVFGADLDQVVGPFETDLGPALFRVNGILEADVISFDDAREQLFDELATETARRTIDAKSAEIDDAVQDGDFPTVEPLEDGGIFALRLDAIVPPAPTPLDEITDQVTQDWRAAETRAALETRASEVISTGEVIGNAKQLLGLKRNDFGTTATADILAAAFKLDAGASQAVPQGDTVVIVRVDAINAGDTNDADAKTLRDSIQQQFGASLADDLFSVFATQIQQSAGITLNQQAINAVHANFQ